MPTTLELQKFQWEPEQKLRSGKSTTFPQAIPNQKVTESSPKTPSIIGPDGIVVAFGDGYSVIWSSARRRGSQIFLQTNKNTE